MKVRIIEFVKLIQLSECVMNSDEYNGKYFNNTSFLVCIKLCPFCLKKLFSEIFWNRLISFNKTFQPDWFCSNTDVHWYHFQLFSIRMGFKQRVEIDFVHLEETLQILAIIEMPPASHTKLVLVCFVCNHSLFFYPSPNTPTPLSRRWLRRVSGWTEVSNT